MTVAALFVDARGLYPRLLGSELCWDAERDARLYKGPWSVVAHPPCQLWVNLAASNWARGQRDGKPRPYPAWYPGGSDGGCFEAALRAVRRFGGVLEHPAFSWAWRRYGVPAVPRPAFQGWHGPVYWGGVPVWVCEVWQSAYGHLCRKRTWLCYVGERPPLELDWRRLEGTHQVGWFDRKKPTVSKKQAIHSPLAFAEMLIKLAEHAVF